MRDDPKDVEACDCVDFYDAANARPYGREECRVEPAISCGRHRMGNNR
jgi:hypothetical protein